MTTLTKIQKAEPQPTTNAEARQLDAEPEPETPSYCLPQLDKAPQWPHDPARGYGEDHPEQH